MQEDDESIVGDNLTKNIDEKEDTEDTKKDKADSNEKKAKQKITNKKPIENQINISTVGKLLFSTDKKNGSPAFRQ